MRTFQKYVGVAAVVTGLLVAPATAQSNPIDPSTLSCAAFLDLDRAANSNGRTALTAKMDFTRVGYWVLVYLNGFFAADGQERIVGFRDRGVGRTVMKICAENPHESLMSATAATAILAGD